MCVHQVCYLSIGCNGKMEVVNPEGHIEKMNISLETIMMFATGMPEEPPMGFQPKPSIMIDFTKNLMLI